MKYLGIDYGKKRTGLAVSSDDGSIAFPLRVIETTHTLANTIAEIVDTEHIEKIIIGESKDRAGNDNAIMEDVRDLMGQLSLLVTIPIDTQREDFSTSSAMRSMIPEKNVTRSRAKKPTGDSDARAAALILQRYLDKT
jgi:putative Holliday junction resolvase